MTGRDTHHVVLFVFAILLCGMSLSSCAIYTGRSILGGTSQFTEGRYQIISDFKISDLQIRHVRRLDVPKEECHNDGVLDHIQLSGPINADATYVVDKLLESIKNSTRCNSYTPLYGNPSRGVGRDIFPYGIPNIYHTRPVAVYLHSRGGDLRDGYALGEVFRKHRARTIVSYGGECLSSCATAFLGGYSRSMSQNSTLLFHAPYTRENNFSRDIVCISESDPLLDGVSATEELKGYFVRMLRQKEGNLLYQRTMSYCSNTSGWSLNPNAARLFGLLTPFHIFP